MSERIKSCPFCRGEGQVSIINNVMCVMCIECDSRGSVCYISDADMKNSDIFEAKSKLAIVEWNRRVNGEDFIY